MEHTTMWVCVTMLRLTEFLHTISHTYSHSQWHVSSLLPMNKGFTFKWVFAILLYFVYFCESSIEICVCVIDKQQCDRVSRLCCLLCHQTYLDWAKTYIWTYLMDNSVTLTAFLYSRATISIYQQSAFIQPNTIRKCNYYKSGLICEILQ